MRKRGVCFDALFMGKYTEEEGIVHITSLNHEKLWLYNFGKVVKLSYQNWNECGGWFWLIS